MFPHKSSKLGWSFYSIAEINVHYFFPFIFSFKFLFLVHMFSTMFQDGHPPLGWQDTAAYLVLPVLLIVSQYVSMEIMKPPQVQ